MPEQHPQPDPADVEGFDPDVAERDTSSRRINLSTVQVGAAAAASVTSALAASFFGVAGTLIGAAVGSIVSTVAGAIYAESMKRAAERVKVTQAIVVAKVAPTGAVPSLQIGKDARNPQTGHPVHPTLPTQAGRPTAQDSPPTMVDPAMTVPVTAHARLTAGDLLTANDRVTWWRRRPVTMVGMMLLGFAIALGVITGIEQLGGGTLSGDKGSPSISRVFGQSTSTDDGDRTGTSTPTPSTSPTSSTESSQAPVAPTVTTAPSSGTTPTAQPTAQPTASVTTAPTASAGTDQTGDSVDSATGGSAESRLSTDSTSTTTP